MESYLEFDDDSLGSLGLLRTDIVSDSNLFFTQEFQQDLICLETYCDGIFNHAFDYDKRQKLDSIEDIDLTLDTTYIVEYRIDKNNFFIQLYKEFFIISHSRRSYVEVSLSLINLLRKYILLSDFTLVGFETSLFLEEYPNCINSILSDGSLYPLYVNQSKGSLSFTRYGGYEPAEKFIESFLENLFAKNLLFR